MAASGSILEVGTGFHPELTGRENTYLNGAILGMKRREISAKFDEIVEFSGIEKFIDTPVKRYSSGMYVRLAFAVAAHLDPEVLIIDEVLAVGDYEFQQRCMGRIEDISSSGRTVIFVSHDMQAITRLCNRAYWLHGGELVAEGRRRGRRLALPPGGVGNGRGDDLRPRRGAGHRARPAPLRARRRHERRDGAYDRRPRAGRRSSCASSSSARPARCSRSSSSATIAARSCSTPSTPTRAGVEPPEPGTYTCTAWIPPNLLNEGVIGVDVDRRLARRAEARQPRQHAGARHVPRPRPGPRRHGQGPLHGPAPRRRAAAPRLDDASSSRRAPTRRRSGRPGRSSRASSRSCGSRAPSATPASSTWPSRAPAARPWRSRRGAGRSCCRGSAFPSGP